ncbi:hypothetical protein NSK_007667 [Nannochloropsis salina CCMP1776]|uniref:Uncharacterized protein n=1 Tax=Nannochloropsis salina CCMP1776 TaxID=1027361 RepID=A0A4D9CR66_9STRA|nr:hypothetical protein NSK_007667 [Nannochloropsis salina CCMP1776]|eukprot:TFJ81024.1 hypothetical protein NSK_007667 [Nannochloropsis salina CCMP1776]
MLLDPTAIYIFLHFFRHRQGLGAHIDQPDAAKQTQQARKRMRSQHQHSQATFYFLRLHVRNYLLLLLSASINPYWSRGLNASSASTSLCKADPSRLPSECPDSCETYE